MHRYLYFVLLLLLTFDCSGTFAFAREVLCVSIERHRVKPKPSYHPKSSGDMEARVSRCPVSAASS